MSNDLEPLDLDPDLDPWDQQPRESIRRHNQFCVYRDLGRSRTLRKAAEQLSLNADYLRGVASAMLWVERAEAWDQHREVLHDQQRQEEREKAESNDARVLNALIGKIAARLATINPEELTPSELIRYMDVTLRARRALFN